ncbi:hypothetical protein ACWEDZ_39835, partial [Streptomyces sp. NPDC005047]
APRAISSMLGCMAAVRATESPSQLRPALIQRIGTQLPVGVVTSVVGAPYLLWLLARAGRAGRGG